MAAQHRLVPRQVGRGFTGGAIGEGVEIDQTSQFPVGVPRWWPDQVRS
jgi:hypothetical protein